MLTFYFALMYHKVVSEKESLMETIVAFLLIAIPSLFVYLTMDTVRHFK